MYRNIKSSLFVLQIGAMALLMTMYSVQASAACYPLYSGCTVGFYDDFEYGSGAGTVCAFYESPDPYIPYGFNYVIPYDPLVPVGYLRSYGVAPMPVVGQYCDPVDTSTTQKIFEQSDPSGRVTIAIFDRYSTIALSHNTDFAVTVPSDYVVIGGGAEGTNTPEGNVLTASYPNADLTSWLVSTKDHVDYNPVRAHGWAIGLKVAGLTAAQLRNYIVVNSAASDYAAHPDVTASLPAGYVLLGGGFKVNWIGSGNLATASAPSGATSWRVRSKDHEISSPATADAYVIGLSAYIAGIGSFESNINVASSAVAEHPDVTLYTSYGYVLSGCGAYANWAGPGSLLWKIRPFGAASDQAGCSVGAKDHNIVEWSSVDGYAIGLRSY